MLQLNIVMLVDEKTPSDFDVRPRIPETLLRMEVRVFSMWFRRLEF